MKKNPEKTAQTKVALKAAFWTLYQNRPITKITVQDVTNLAGFNRSTFYQYFHDVYCVLEEIEDSVINEWEVTFSKNKGLLIKQNRDEAIIEMTVDFYERNGNYLSVLLSPDGDSSFAQKLKNAMRPKIFAILQVPDDSIEASLIFEFASSGMLAVLTAWYHSASHIPTKDVVELIYSLLYRNDMTGISPMQRTTNSTKRSTKM